MACDQLENELSKNRWNPECEESKKPYVNQIFPNLVDAFEFYKEYGRVCGFDVRRSTQKLDRNGNISLKYFLCSSAGYYEVIGSKSSGSDSSVNSCFTENTEKVSDEIVTSPKKLRRTITTKTGCLARVVLKKVGVNGYVIQYLNEEHNHRLAVKDAKQFLRCSRSLSEHHKKFIVDSAKLNIGPTRAHGIYKSMVGSYSNVGATAVDFKNFARDIKDYIGLHDADMILQKFKDKFETSDKSFRYEYQTDSKNHLTRLFWSDASSRRSYDVFGDVVSFDATYRTNKYSMVFVPFIGIDNHWRSITFAAALLDKEDVENFTWVCEAFQKTMGHSPKCIVTDQCPAMKVAIPKAFPGVKHRLCMWHIMKKFPAKLGSLFCAESPFLDKLNHFVWSEHSSPAEFEDGWNAVIEQFNLTDNTWLSEMYELRSFWIPAYFNNDPMAGLLRTTSRSESSNFYFNHFVQRGDTLSEFYLCYESAIEKQRHTNAKMNHQDNSSPKLITEKSIEKDAAELYTRTIFYKVQQEIKGCSGDIEIESMTMDNGLRTFAIKDLFMKNKIFQVTVNIDTHDVDCTCKLFIRVGYLCKHCFFCLGICGIHKIPIQYLSNRWLKNAEDRFSTLNLGELTVPNMKQDRIQSKIKDCWFQFQSCISNVCGNEDLLDFVCETVNSLKNKTIEMVQKNKTRLDDDTIEKLIGSKVVEEISVLPPNKSNNKGCRKRIVGAVEKSLSGKKRQTRECKACGKQAFHDSRNCPMKTEPSSRNDQPSCS